jgi:hypothetical protein
MKLLLAASVGLLICSGRKGGVPGPCSDLAVAVRNCAHVQLNRRSGVQ